MLVESPAQIATDTRNSLDVAPVRTIQQIAENAAKKPGGSDARLLASLAISAVERMNAVVFGEQTYAFPEAMQLAKRWATPTPESDTEKGFDTEKLREYQRKITQEAYTPFTPIGTQEIEIFSKEISGKEKADPRRPDIHDARVQARYVTGSLLLYILYLDPDYRGIHPSKPTWHANAGATALASIITSDAAEVMSRKEKSINHQNDIDTLIEKGLINW